MFALQQTIQELKEYLQQLIEQHEQAHKRIFTDRKKTTEEIKNFCNTLAGRECKCLNCECKATIDENEEACPECGVSYKIPCPQCAKLTHVLFAECQHSYPPHPLPQPEKIVYSAIVSSRYCRNQLRYLQAFSYLEAIAKLLADNKTASEYKNHQTRYAAMVCTEACAYKKDLLAYVQTQTTSDTVITASIKSPVHAKIDTALQNEQYLHALRIVDAIPEKERDSIIRNYREKICSYLCKEYLDYVEQMRRNGQRKQAIIYLRQTVPQAIWCQAIEDKIDEISRESKRIHFEVELEVQKLQDWNYDVRETAAKKLAKLGSAAMKSLIQSLHNEDWRARWAAAEALKKMGVEAAPAITELAACLKDENLVMRQAAAETLAEIGRKSIPAILPLLADDALDVKLIAIEALKKMGSEAAPAVPELIRLLSDKQWRTRVAAIDALRKIGTLAGSAVPAVVACLTDHDKRVQCAAAKALGKMGPEVASQLSHLVAILRDPTDDLRRTVAETLGNLGVLATPAILALRSTLQDQNIDVRIAATDALGKIGPQAFVAVPDILKLLRQEHWRVRKIAAESLGEMGSEAASAIPHLARALKDKVTDVRRAAAEALRKMGPRAAPNISELIQALKDESPKVRLAAIEAIGEIGAQATKAIGPLNQALKDKDEDTRWAIKVALAKIMQPHLQ